ncbi:MAG: ribonuclease R [Saprospiraceae bacterium]|nr:ribonuclease R [Saprospiraceae bacterium]
MKGKKLTSAQLTGEILRLFKRHPKKRLNPKQVIRKLKVANNKDSVEHVLEKLTRDQQLINMGEFKYKLRKQEGGNSSDLGLHEGKVDMTRTGSAYIILDDMEEDVHVSAKHMNTAMNGDRVKIRVWLPRGRRRPEGEVMEIVERKTEHFIGTFWRKAKYGVVQLDDLTTEVQVDLNNSRNAENEDKVVVKVIDWKSAKFRNPEGEVTSVLGKAGSSDIEMKSILIKNGFQLDFPAPVMDEANKLSEVLPEEEIAKRRDMRQVPTFTIDPDDAKDFDDALSYQYLDNGNLEIGVHIADVTHYVKEGTALDKEALDRSTSVYLVDRVLPMLPEKLSNKLCSLRPNEDKFTFSAVFTFDKNDRVVDRWFGKTVIHSDRRFTYNQAQEVLDSGEGDMADELKVINRIATKLRKKRFKEGAINFETEEVKFKLDENGVPISVYTKERKDAHMLIEDFMLLANREVATYMSELGRKYESEVPYIYRVHDEPDPEKVEQFARFAREMGVEMKVDSAQAISKSYNALVKKALTDERLKLLEPLAIRTMAKAAYSSDNIGHYGLGFDNYSHFTSPIRRYSDVLAHRLLEKNLEVKGQPHRTKKALLEEQCQHISAQERRANDAERESIKYKQVEFMEKHVGDIFKGQISGIIERGVFVELNGNRCEGFIPFDTTEEPFEVGAGNLSIKGRYSGDEYRMGDEITVKIIDTDLAKRRIEMAWVKNEN